MSIYTANESAVIITRQNRFVVSCILLAMYVLCILYVCMGPLNSDIPQSLHSLRTLGLRLVQGRVCPGSAKLERLVSPFCVQAAALEEGTFSESRGLN